MRKMLKFFKDEVGATAVEYGLLIALIAVAIIAAVTTFSPSLVSWFGPSAGG